METERIALSQRERDRLKVLHEVKQKTFDASRSGPAAESNRSPRAADAAAHARAWRWCDRSPDYAAGPRTANWRRAFEQKILARVRQRYADFGPTLAAEHLAQDGLRGEPGDAAEMDDPGGLVAAAHASVCKPMHVWRERRASFGELVMQDSSPFRWLEDRGPACHLIALIDDATSRIWGRFTEHDTTEENLRTLRRMATALWTSSGPLHR